MEQKLEEGDYVHTQDLIKRGERGARWLTRQFGLDRLREGC
jgi:hypothetical protein